jgi:hypothetical protein
MLEKIKPLSHCLITAGKSGVARVKFAMSSLFRSPSVAARFHVGVTSHPFLAQTQKWNLLHGPSRDQSEGSVTVQVCGLRCVLGKLVA